jgi:prepilin-type N-terminal cleavage/methylation domain-containing protein
MRTRRRGFTLIELLVVIAIIGILAAMLFPVFARARESARKVQCLSNVKNIAMAIQMYLTDYDCFPPREHRPEVQAAFDAHGDTDNCQYATGANPYLRWPVILDEYIKNRDVWSCPSAGRMPRTSICPGPDWFAVTMSHEGDANGWGCYGSICTGIYPPGWGGSITDSWTQQDCPTSRTDGKHSEGAFVQTIGCPSDYELKTSAISDPARHVVCGETGAIDTMWDASLAAYPDICGLACCMVGGVSWSDKPYGLHADWVNCSWSQECGAGDLRLRTDIEYRKTFCKARHLGGENLGYADGHAKWMSAEAIISGTIDRAQPNRTDWLITGGIQACTYPRCRQG